VKTTIAERIRAAALGPLPHGSAFLSSWPLSGKAMDTLSRHIPQGVSGFGGFLRTMSTHERRMFLLFVAEAVK
jgi:hypothetical protein